MNRRNPTSVKVAELDLSSFEAQALEYVRTNAVDPERGMPTSIRFGEQYGIVEVGEHLYALCTEGVGPDNPITDEKPLEIGVYISQYEGDGESRFIPMFPSATLRLGPKELRAAKTGKEIPLDEFVRTFGARLDSNYESWRSRLEGVALAV